MSSIENNMLPPISMFATTAVPISPPMSGYDSSKPILPKPPIYIPDSSKSSDQVLAEKRKRNAGASARFRDRRKQREKELIEKCNFLEKRAKELENALRSIHPDHPLVSNISPSPPPQLSSSSPPPSSLSLSSLFQTSLNNNNTLTDRVSQLEQMMCSFKDSNYKKLQEIETENKYLRSLLLPSRSSISSVSSLSDNETSRN